MISYVKESVTEAARAAVRDVASRAQAAPLESLYVRGPIDFYGAQGKLYANGQLFHVKGVTWYGSEGKLMVLEHLKDHSMESIFSFLAEQRFNAIRLLFNMQDLRDNPRVTPGGWRFERIREDKKLPNDKSTVSSILRRLGA